MAKDGKVELLRRVSIFQSCNQKVLEEICSRAEEVDLRADKVLCREGRFADELFVIFSGRVRVERNGRRLATYGAGDVIGDLTLLDGRPRATTAVTEEPTRVLVIPRRDFHTLVADHQVVREQIMVTMRLQSLA